MRFVKLGNILSIHKGKKPKFTEITTENSIRVLQIDDLRNDNKIQYTDEKTGVLANEEDLLIAWDGANAGTIGYGKSGYIGSTIAILRKKKPNEFSTTFLGMFLQSQSAFLKGKSTGATIPHIDRKSLENLVIPTIPLDDQIRIATLLSKVEALIKQRKESIDLLDEYLKSTFLEMFGDPTRNEKSWNKKAFEDLVAYDCPLTYGIVQPGEEYPNGIPVIRPVDLTQTFIDRNGLKLIDPKISDKFKRTLLKGNELLICVRGTTGVISIATKKLVGCNVTRGITPIWFSENYDRYFAFHLLQTTAIKRNIQELTYGATLKQINLCDLRKIQLINPPLHLQTFFGEIATKVFEIKAQYQSNLAELNNLYGSLNQRAFKGKLNLEKSEEMLMAVETVEGYCKQK